MKVIVLGAGVIGTACAYYLSKAGHEVTVIDRRSGPALETSFGNAGGVCPGFAGPWAAPGMPLKVVRWLFAQHAPLMLRPRLDLRQWQWLAAFVDWWNGDGAWTRLPEATRASFRALGWKVFQEVISLTSDRTSREEYARIIAPTLIMGGRDSPLPERRVVEKLGATLPHATVMFFNAGHMGPVSHASLVNAAIAAHLSSV